MTLYYVLNKDINPKKFLEDVRKEIVHNKTNKDDVLVVEIRKTVEVVEDIAKQKTIEYLKENPDD